MYTIKISNNDNNLINSILFYIDFKKLFNVKDFICFNSNNKLNRIELIPNLNSYEFLFNNEKIFISIEESEKEHVIQDNLIINKIIVLLKSNNKENLETFIKESVQNYKKSNLNTKVNSDKNINHYYFNGYNWEIFDVYNKRNLDTIYLENNELNKIISDMDIFLNNTEILKKYEDLGLTSSRIYMFYGLPGTGKTTLSYCLASYFNINISTIEIEIDTNNTILKRAFRDLPDKSILLIEDLDHMFNYSDNKEENNNHNISLSGLLNILDGIFKFKNILCILTCNKISDLKDTIIRRVDYFLEFKYAEISQITNLYNKFYPNSNEEDKKKFLKFFQNKKTTINILQKWFLKNLNVNNLYSSKNLDYNTFDSFNQIYIKEENTNKLFL
tara:strand:+ start:111 stop:1271 length:1161 start_codon:yes stop_codon:yes gene_type:complete